MIFVKLRPLFFWESWLPREHKSKLMIQKRLMRLERDLESGEFFGAPLEVVDE